MDYLVLYLGTGLVCSFKAARSRTSGIPLRDGTATAWLRAAHAKTSQISGVTM